MDVPVRMYVGGLAAWVGGVKAAQGEYIPFTFTDDCCAAFFVTCMTIGRFLGIVLVLSGPVGFLVVLSLCSGLDVGSVCPTVRGDVDFDVPNVKMSTNKRADNTE
jgi:hypothetical protein